MKRSTLDLTNALVTELQPVRPMRPPWTRALLWLLAISAVAGGLIGRHADIQGFVTRLQDAGIFLECAAALGTGLLGVVAAFHLSVPGDSRAWVRASLASAGVWLICTTFHCVYSWAQNGGIIGSLSDSSTCFKFIVSASVPLALSLFVLLRRSRPLWPGQAGAVGALGVTGFAVFFLQFFHPPVFALIDMLMHLVAVGLVIVIGGLISRQVLD